MESIKFSADLLLSLISDILDLSKIEVYKRGKKWEIILIYMFLLGACKYR